MRLLLVIALLGSCATTRPEAPADPRERGAQALEQGRVADAVTALEAHQATRPDDVDGARMLAQAYARRGQYDKAIATWEGVLAARPDDGDGWRQLGDLHFALGHYARAAESYRTAQSHGAEDASLVVRTAESEIALRRPAMAIAFLDAHGGGYDDVAAIHLARARALAAQNKPHQAIEALRIAARLDEEDPTPLVEMGSIYETMDFPDRAVAAYKQALERQPEHAQTLTRLGRALIVTGDAADAIPLLMRAARLRPEDVSVRNNLGVAYTQAMLYREAVEAFQAGLAIDGEVAALHSNLAEAHYHLADLAPAETHLRKAVALDAGRMADAGALRRIVIMREIAGARCASGSMPSSEALRRKVASRYQAEGWGEYRDDLEKLLNDSGAMQTLQQVIARCGGGAAR